MLGAVRERIPPPYRRALRRTFTALGLPVPGAPWSIGVYRGDSPLVLAPASDGPVLTARDVTDVRAEFVADPFLARRDGRWSMVFEVWDRRRAAGEIGLAESADGLRWTYRGIVLREDVHLSYPYVFAWGGEQWMIPETHQAREVRLYRAVDPRHWVREATLLRGMSFSDSSVVHHGDRWWMFTETDPDYRSDTLRLFSAPEPAGPWTEHPCSPLIAGDPATARPAGRIVAHDGGLVRYAQGCETEYGKRVRAFRITRLTATDYEEEPVPTDVLGPSGRGWNAAGMHHVDPHRLDDGTWIAAVDGR